MSPERWASLVSLSDCTSVQDAYGTVWVRDQADASGMSIESSRHEVAAVSKFFSVCCHYAAVPRFSHSAAIVQRFLSVCCCPEVFLSLLLSSRGYSQFAAAPRFFCSSSERVMALKRPPTYEADSPRSVDSPAAVETYDG